MGPLDPDRSCSGKRAVGEKRLMIARRPIALPSVAHPVERFEPEVAPVFGACSAADKNSSARSEDAVERGSGRLGIEPVDRAADTDNVEFAALSGKVLEPALEELTATPARLAAARAASTMPGSGSCLLYTSPSPRD